MSPSFERQKIVSLALGAGLIAGFAGGAMVLVALGVVNSNSQGGTTGLLATPAVKNNRIVLEESSAVIDAVKKVSPSVVSITTSSSIQDYFTGQRYQQKGGSTGFVLTSDGLIVTNKHVVANDTTQYTVLTADGSSYEAKVVSRDPFNDLAVLRVAAKGLKPVELGDSNALQIGQWVIAIGNALGEFQNTVTVGVVSAKERRIATGDQSLDGLIQTDAAINPGNSGGPLVNLSGQVVGINTAIAGGAEGIGFAINIDSVKTALDSVQSSGKIVRPYLGVSYQLINKEVAQSAKLPVDHGALVYRGPNPGDLPVVPGGPADRAGIQENDIILKVNGQEVNENNGLASLLQKYKVGDTVSLDVLRQGKEITIKVTLEELKQ